MADTARAQHLQGQVEAAKGEVHMLLGFAPNYAEDSYGLLPAGCMDRQAFNKRVHELQVTVRTLEAQLDVQPHFGLSMENILKARTRAKSQLLHLLMHTSPIDGNAFSKGLEQHLDGMVVALLELRGLSREY